jgi:5-methylcytosine-specific restriction enzyme subunit McrC
MIHRSILEWTTISFGEAADKIPVEAAARLAAVADKSSFAGSEGGGVLEYGRKGLRARDIVGVVVAPGCTLEILPKIDLPGASENECRGNVRRRLIHMLAVALELEIDAGQLAALDWQQETLLEILIRLFSERLVDAVRQGLPRLYVPQSDDLPMLRGRLNVTRQFTVLAAEGSRLACCFDALTPDIALNQIMKAAVRRVSQIAQRLDNQRRLRELSFAYAEISDIPIARLPWDRVAIDRTNAQWRELLGFARLILGDRFQTTSTGEQEGFSLLFEMNSLFEEYVARMLRRALVDTDVRVVSQGGRLYCLEAEDRRGLFQTRPDILLKRGNQVVQVIDTKWKRVVDLIDDRKRGVSQGDVYQMIAYGQLYNCDRLTLLYPHHLGLKGGEGLIATHQVTGSNRNLEIATIDIGTSREFGARLKAITAANALPA